MPPPIPLPPRWAGGGRREKKGRERQTETETETNRERKRGRNRKKKIQQPKRFTLQKNSVFSEKKKLALDKNQMTWVSGFYIPDILL